MVDDVLERGAAIGPFALEAKLGEGAVGVVFRARDARTGGLVALKVLRPDLARNPAYVARFEREARVAASVTSPRLVAVLEAGMHEGWHVLASEYVVGGTLGDRLARSGPLAVPELVRLASHVGAALDALHTCGLVHRDVKPSNVLVDADGSARLTDYGLARGPALTVLTRPGQLLGTPAYLAPELVEGGEATAASDLYSLGCVLFECVSGVPPFSSPKLFEVIISHVQREPPDLRQLRPDLPRGVADAIRHALAKSPGQRPATGRLLAGLLAAAAN